nr:hypothetical protein [Tanacetum cinerariifolium]
MNYVPVDAGTNSTNFSGTKDAASQEVKKDVSSLRYIALPNWVHDALLESSSSKPQDDCSTDVPESSGICNPTATSTNPSADQMESLTLETPIPTISSLVLTVCLNNSPEPSSDTRLISKRVANPEETPSLDNILTLTNRFEDILGVTTNLVDSDGVEADEEGIDYDEVFAPVVRIKAIRLFLAYASFMGFTVYQIDVKSTFLYGTIDEEVYVMQPPGLQDPEFSARVYKVEKAMYGLHQAPRAWRMVFFSQDKYVADILKKFGYSNVRSSNTPMDKENPWGKDRTRKDVDFHLYRSMIGSLMYLTASRPDIMFAVCACARNQVTPKECHLHAVKRIFRYLKGHPKLGLWYPKESPFDLVAYSDSDYGGATQDRKSTTEGDCFEKNLISMDHIHTDENVVDLLTIPFDAGRFQYLVSEHNVDFHPIVDFVEASPLREGVAAERSRDDAPIKGRNLDEGEAVAVRVSDDTEEMETVLTSMETSTILASGPAEVPTGSGSTPTAGSPAAEVPIGSDVVPTASLLFATATVVSPYIRRKGKETMVESETLKKKKIQEQMDIQMSRQLEEELERDAQRMNKQIAREVEIARIYAEEELQIMIDGLDRSNETVDKYLSKILSLWTQKEEAERFKRKGIRFEQESVKKLKTSEEVLEEVKTHDEVLKEMVKEMMQLVPIEEVYVEALQVKHPIIDWKVYTEGQKSYWKIIRLGGSSASYQFFVDLLKHIDREDLNQLWVLVKESLSNKPPTSDKEMIYDMCEVHQVTSKDKEIFMLVEKDYPLRKGLAIVMIYYKLQVKNYSQMENDLILKIYKIENCPSQQGD